MGSIGALTDASGNIPATYVYDSFGNQTSSTGSVFTSFRYTARELDGEAGFYYYRARYYLQGVGRFAGEDPLRFRVGKDFYLYASNSPVNAIDPFGLKTIVIIVYDTTDVLGKKITYGAHSAVYIENGGDPILYDPAGSYSSARKCGSGETCFESDADPDKFRRFQEGMGSTVRIFSFDTTRQQEAEMAKRIDDLGGRAPGFCTRGVSSVLSGIGPFKQLKRTFLPGSLADQLEKLQSQARPKE